MCLPNNTEMGQKSTKSRIVATGLDAAGKTTAFYLLKLGNVETIYLKEFERVYYERLQYKGIEFDVIDIANYNDVDNIFDKYFRDCQALIYFVDSNDTERMKLSHNLLHKILCIPQMINAPVLIFANKQDLPKALSVSQVQLQLGMRLTIDVNMLNQIKHKCLLNVLPNDVLSIITQFLDENECKPYPWRYPYIMDDLLQNGRFIMSCFGFSDDHDDKKYETQYGMVLSIVNQIVEYLPKEHETNMSKIGKQKRCFVQGCCVTQGDGLYEGLDWLSITLQDIEKERQTQKQATSKSDCIVM